MRVINLENAYEDGKKWLKNLAYGGLIAGMLSSPIVSQPANANEYEQVKPKNEIVKEVEDKSQFTSVDKAYIGEAGDGDEDKEIVMIDNREDGSMVKIYPIGEEDPFDVIYDIDKEAIPANCIDALAISAYQNDADSVTFKVILRENSDLTDNISYSSIYIDADRSRDTGQDTQTLGIDYDIDTEYSNSKDEWTSQIMGSYGKKKLPGKTSSKVEGNEIITTVNLDDIDTNETFDFAHGINLSPMFWSSVDLFPHDHAPNNSDYRTGTLTLDSDLEERGGGDFSKVFSTSENIEDVNFEEIDGKQGITLKTDGEDLFFSGE